MMGMKPVGSQSIPQESHLQPSPLELPSAWYDLSLQPVGNQMDRSWYDLSLKPVGNQIESLKKPLDCISLDNNLTTLSTFEASKTDHALSLLQRQGSSTPPAKALTRNTVDEVWKEIHQVQKKRSDGDVILEDFLGKSEVSLDTSLSLSSSMRLGTSEEKFPQCFTPQMASSPAPSVGSLSESTVTKRERADPDEYDHTVSRRLKRMIKNRESAARSRERKQAYQSELLARISYLEEENSRLMKEKEFDAKFPDKSPLVPKYQLRRTNSSQF